ncbi:MAG: DUF6702 family protein [Saprospiraceae bacterium]
MHPLFLVSLLLLLPGISRSTSTAPEAIVPHALYLAVVQIDHSQAGTEAKLLVKVFASDLESVLRAAYGEQFRREAGEDFPRANSRLIEAYFREHLVCMIDGKIAGLQYSDAQRENDVFWLNFALQVPVRWKKMSVQASFFMEIFSTQSNIIHLIHSGEKRFARLTKAEDTVGFEW